jgi:hypothetical protein
MAAHVWDLAAKQPRDDRYRAYVCTRCGKGPIQKDVLDGKDSLLDAAKKAGISTDCNIEIAKKIMEE